MLLHRLTGGGWCVGVWGCGVVGGAEWREGGKCNKELSLLLLRECAVWGWPDPSTGHQGIGSRKSAAICHLRWQEGNCPSCLQTAGIGVRWARCWSLGCQGTMRLTGLFPKETFLWFQWSCSISLRYWAMYPHVPQYSCLCLAPSLNHTLSALAGALWVFFYSYPPNYF